MVIPLSSLPTHVALVARRLNVVGAEASADTFLCASYLAEVAIKTIALTFHAGMAEKSPAHAYQIAYELVRADGLGSWESAIRTMTNQPLASYFPPEFQVLLAWATKKRTKPDDEWFRQAKADTDSVLRDLGNPDEVSSRPQTTRELISALVQIRNKTKAHGAVGPDFFAATNPKYLRAVTSLVSKCPLFAWRWMDLSLRENQKVRGVFLRGDSPHNMSECDIGVFVPKGAGVHFVPDQSARAFPCSDLIRVNRECTEFRIPNGGCSQNGQAEFLDYFSGTTFKESIASFSLPPAPLPRSETHGMPMFDVQSNVWGNLPPLPEGYVERKVLQGELEAKLLDKNHPIITLHGIGGVGKTSLALCIAHQLASKPDPHFEHIVWFSARDVDLGAAGPRNVQPAVIDLEAVSKTYGQLFGTEGTVEGFAKTLQNPQPISNKGILFIFDNFETMTEVTALHKFLDTHTHLPNKALITTRVRAFRADYDIPVRGMELEEAVEMMQKLSHELGITGIVTEEVIDKIYAFTEGHAYLMRIILGEIQKEGRYVPANQAVIRRQDIVEAVFERSFNRLSPSGRWAFLTVSNWKTAVSELALIVVLGQRGLDVESGLEECTRLSLLFREDTAEGQPCYFAPQLARVFGKKKLIGDHDRQVIQEDLETLHRFGLIDIQRLEEHTQATQIQKFVRWCTNEAAGKSAEEIQRLDSLLATVASLWPSTWLDLAMFRQQFNEKREEVEYALRRAVEEQPFRKEAWLKRADYASRVVDDTTRIASLVSAVDADPNDSELIREVAFQLSRYINDHLLEIPKSRRGVYLASVRSHMERVAQKLDATGLSRLAWLFLLEENIEKAAKYANAGLSKDSTNTYCLKILERLESQRK